MAAAREELSRFFQRLRAVGEAGSSLSLVPGGWALAGEVFVPPPVQVVSGVPEPVR